MASRLRARHAIRASILSRSASSSPTSSSLASVTVIVHGLSVHGSTSRITRVGSPASSSPRICSTRSTSRSA